VEAPLSKTISSACFTVTGNALIAFDNTATNVCLQTLSHHRSWLDFGQVFGKNLNEMSFKLYELCVGAAVTIPYALMSLEYC
jgi:hypothetical protein